MYMAGFAKVSISGYPLESIVKLKSDSDIEVLSKEIQK